MDDENEDNTPETGDDDGHVCDHSACEAKVSTLTDALAAKDDDIAAIAADLTLTKAANYDLLMSVPGTEETTEITEDEPDGDIDSFFV